jgi:hypothetical protein
MQKVHVYLVQGGNGLGKKSIPNTSTQSLGSSYDFNFKSWMDLKEYFLNTWAFDTEQKTTMCLYRGRSGYQEKHLMLKVGLFPTRLFHKGGNMRETIAVCVHLFQRKCTENLCVNMGEGC